MGVWITENSLVHNYSVRIMRRKESLNPIGGRVCEFMLVLKQTNKQKETKNARRAFSSSQTSCEWANLRLIDYLQSEKYLKTFFLSFRSNMHRTKLSFAILFLLLYYAFNKRNSFEEYSYLLATKMCASARERENKSKWETYFVSTWKTFKSHILQANFFLRQKWNLRVPVRAFLHKLRS